MAMAYSVRCEVQQKRIVELIDSVSLTHAHVVFDFKLLDLNLQLLELYIGKFDLSFDIPVFVLDLFVRCDE
mgnify:CR=1 FL=1